MFIQNDTINKMTTNLINTFFNYLNQARLTQLSYLFTIEIVKDFNLKRDC